MSLLIKKQTRAAQVKTELDALRTLLDIAPENKLEEHYQRAQTLTAELRSLNADITELQAEAFDPSDPDGRTAAVNGLVPSICYSHSGEITGYCTGDGQTYRASSLDEVPAFVRNAVRSYSVDVPEIVAANARSQQTRAYGAQTRENMSDKVLFRHGENLSDKYECRDIDVDRVLRAAITGNRDLLNDAERRAMTPTAGGAMLAPEVSSIIIDNMRQSDWMQALQPTLVPVSANEMQIPNITGLPTAIMHEPGTRQNFSDPIITGAILTPRTMIVLCMVTNELLQDSLMSQRAITQAIVSAASNKLLQQVMYGTGVAPEMKGITLYDHTAFAAAGDMSAEKDLFSLATLADTAIIRRNGAMDAMLYDPGLEPRLNKRLATGELVEPSRAFKRLYDAGRTLAHPSIEAGDMLFMRSGALYIGMRQDMKIEVDPSQGFDANSTAIRLTMRADVFADAAHMAYYSGITEVEPA